MPQPEWEAWERELRELRQRVARLEAHAGLSAEAAAAPPLAPRPLVLAEDRPLALAGDHPLVLAKDRSLALAENRPLALAEDRPLALAEDRPAIVPEGHPLALAEDRPLVPAENPSLTLAEDHPLAEIPNLLPIVGRALLGLAGAYLLRALTESGTLPASLGIAAGIAYALSWLGWAARRPLAERWSAAIDSLTSVLILSPLLWEATARFHLLGAWTTAVVLLVFAVFGMAISWRKSLLIVSAFATLASLGTGAALLVATRDVLPFTFLLLAVAAAIEVSACLDHYLSERWLGALAADLAVLLATFLVTNERGLPAGYAPIPGAWLLTAQVALLTIYLSSIIVRTLLRGYSVTAFEMAQCAVAFAIGLGGGARTGPVMAGAMVVCAAACYLASFVLLERRKASGRNFYAYSTFGIVLAVVGSGMLLSSATASWAWSALAVGFVWAGGRFGRLTLQVHGAIYLLLALVTSGALQESAGVLLGTARWAGERQIELWTGLAASAAAYSLTVHYRFDDGPSRTWQLCRPAIAASFIWLAAALAAGELSAGAPQAYIATIRTGVLACVALLLAWLGPRWERRELSILVYPAMLLGGYRLLTADIHQGDKVALFLSLLMLGTVATILPRLKSQPRLKRR
jgi:hypothetical protein